MNRTNASPRAAVLLVALTLTPSLARAGTTLRLRLGGTIAHTPSFELPAEGSGMPAIGADVGLCLLETPADLKLEIGLSYSGVRSRLFGTGTAGLRLGSLEVGVAYHQPIFDALGFSLRAGVLGDLGRLRIESPQTYDVLRGSGVSFGLFGLAGLEIFAPLAASRRSARASSGPRLVRVGFEAGYRWRPLPMRFGRLRRRTARASDPPRIDLVTIDAGALDLSSWVFAFHAGVAF